MKLIILDRDGVINQDSKHYIKSPEEWIPIEGSLEAISFLNNHGYIVVVATNQSAISKKLFTHATLNKIHQKFHLFLILLYMLIQSHYLLAHSLSYSYIH